MANPVCGCAASPCGPTAGSTSPSCGRCCVSTGISGHWGSPGSPTSESSSGFLTRSSNPPSIAWSAAVTRNETSTGFGSPRPVRGKSTSSRRCCRAGSSTSSPAHRISRADPTGLKSRLRSTGSLTGLSRNRTGTSHPSSLPRNFLSDFHDELPAYRFAVRRVAEKVWLHRFLPLAASWLAGPVGHARPDSTPSLKHQKRDKPEFSKPSMTGSSRPTAVGAVRSATPALNALGSSAATKSLTGSTSTLAAPDGNEAMMSSTYGYEQVINAVGPQQVGVQVVAEKAKRVNRCARGAKRVRVECPDQVADRGLYKSGGFRTVIVPTNSSTSGASSASRPVGPNR